VNLTGCGDHAALVKLPPFLNLTNASGNGRVVAPVLLLDAVCGRGEDQALPQVQQILYEKSFNLKTISQGDFGHFRDNNQIILSKVAKIALGDCF